MQQRIIVTDSTSDLDHAFLKQHNVHIVPLSVTINGESYEDQKDISSESFSQYLETVAMILKRANLNWKICRNL